MASDQRAKYLGPRKFMSKVTVHNTPVLLLRQIKTVRWIRNCFYISYSEYTCETVERYK